MILNQHTLTACNYSYIQLIDFNARFYSPRLGRFIQPDSIIPNWTNPQSLNRFSYVLNSPLMYIDPSGHMYISQPIINEVCIEGECKEGPSLLNSYNLTHSSRGGTGMTGVEFYDWYIQLWFTDGWWWEAYGEDGEFTIFNAMEIGLLGESQNQWPYNDYIFEAETRELYQECNSQPGAVCSTEQIVNFYSAHYESAYRQVFDSVTPDDTYYNETNALAVSNLLANFIKPSNKDWMLGRVSIRPWGSASVSYIYSEYGYNYSDQDYIYIKNNWGNLFFHWGQQWYIPSGCVEHLMDQGINPQFWGNYYCKPVR